MIERSAVCCRWVIPEREGRPPDAASNRPGGIPDFFLAATDAARQRNRHIEREVRGAARSLRSARPHKEFPIPGGALLWTSRPRRYGGSSTAGRNRRLRFGLKPAAT